ncbi:hypothetical protein C5167_038477 [Papaver somniferum]|uniref:Major facilitator superfamily (MFS) profile domain-containing protein n=1 Tax=Papaver somniferum TaxID=3469 RepID=A0A4Y7ID02_PAPSO|nr:hypothetical protein C5167_038477 [Papaver somniferum]
MPTTDVQERSSGFHYLSFSSTWLLLWNVLMRISYLPSTKKSALSSPLAGVLVLRYDRPTVLAMGTLCWAISTAGVGASYQFSEIAFWRAVNGVGLAIVIPALQSFVADSYTDGVRGRGFGMLSLVRSVGGIGGSALATIMAGQEYWGIPGWRCAFIMMALASFDHKKTAALLSLFAIGCAMGSLLGGLIGDRIHAYTQAGGVSWVHSLVLSWEYAFHVRTQHRTMIYAFDRAFEGSFSSFAAPIVGILSEKTFGYDLKSANLASGSLKEAFALSRGLVSMMCVPYALCSLFYTPLYWFYKRDRENAKNAALKEQEMT